MTFGRGRGNVSYIEDVVFIVFFNLRVIIQKLTAHRIKYICQMGLNKEILLF